MANKNLAWLEHLPPGWHILYQGLAAEIAEIDPNIVVSQAKQKLGKLRVYLEQSNHSAEAAVHEAETLSRMTCELCGGRGELRIDRRGWHRTLCDEHGDGFGRARFGEVSKVPVDEMPRAILLDGVDFAWPLFTLDFEASGLGPFTYPIEIGVGRWLSPDDPIESWSVLIKPCDDWRRHRIWMPESEKIHGLKLEDLEKGASPKQALEHANKLIGNSLAYCDGGEHDLRWLSHLTHAGRVRPSFLLAGWESLVASLSPQQHSRMREWAEREPVPHRAGDDARRLLMSLAVGLSVSER